MTKPRARRPVRAKASPQGQATVTVPEVSGHPQGEGKEKRERQNAKRTEQLDKSDYVLISEVLN